MAFLTRLSSLSSLGIFHKLYFFFVFLPSIHKKLWQVPSLCVCVSVLTVCFAFALRVFDEENKNDKTAKYKLMKRNWLLKQTTKSCCLEMFVRGKISRKIFLVIIKTLRLKIDIFLCFYSSTWSFITALNLFPS